MFNFPLYIYLQSNQLMSFNQLNTFKMVTIRYECFKISWYLISMWCVGVGADVIWSWFESELPMFSELKSEPASWLGVWSDSQSPCGSGPALFSSSGLMMVMVLLSASWLPCHSLLPDPTPALSSSPVHPACPSCSGVITEAVETVQNFPSLVSTSSLG